MSRSSAHPMAPLRLAVALVALSVGTGCWEQWSVEWWPQMKWQKAVQAFEATGHPGADATGGFMPPEGAVPISAGIDVAALPVPEQEALQNPRSPTLSALENGRVQFEIFCAPCHGSGGLGDGPIGGPPFGKGPLVGVLPIGGPASLAKVLTDGHIFTTMTLGRGRMPSYRRIPVEDRWDILSYIRYLNGQVGPQSSGGAAQ